MATQVSITISRHDGRWAWESIVNINKVEPYWYSIIKLRWYGTREKYLGYLDIHGVSQSKTEKVGSVRRTVQVYNFVFGLFLSSDAVV